MSQLTQERCHGKGIVFPLTLRKMAGHEKKLFIYIFFFLGRQQLLSFTQKKKEMYICNVPGFLDGESNAMREVRQLG